MKNKFAFLLGVSFLFVTLCGNASAGKLIAKNKKARETTETSSTEENAERDITSTHPWIFGAGMGLTFNPTLFLLSPQVEFPVQHNLYLGPLVQLGLGSLTFVTISGSGRLVFGHDAKFKPSVEGGLGLAIASGFFTSSVGVNIHVGMGLDYQVTPQIKLGTVLRLNFVPPITSVIVSWPIFNVRIAI